MRWPNRRAVFSLAGGLVMESAFYWPVPAAGTIRCDLRRRHSVSEAAMDYKQAVSVLTKMLEERSLDGEEKEAVLRGVLPSAPVEGPGS